MSNDIEANVELPSQEEPSLEKQETIDSEKKSTNKGVGVFVCMLTLLGTKMGAGIVGTPYAIVQVGFTTAVWFQVFFAWIAFSTLWLYLRIRELTGKSSLTSIGDFWYGRTRFLINGLIALSQLGFPIIFFIVFGDVAGTLIEKINTSGISFWSSRWFTHSLLAIVILYLVLKKEIHQLKYAGFILLCLIATFIVLLFVHYLTSDPHPENKVDLKETSIGLKFFASLPTVIASYSIHPSFFTAFGALKNKTSRNGMKAALFANITLFTVYFFAPLIAIGLYGHDVKSDMIKSVSSDSGVIPVVLMFLFLVIAAMHIPIIFFIGKEAILIIFYELTKHTAKQVEVDANGKTVPDKSVEVDKSSSEPQSEEQKVENQESNQEQIDTPVQISKQNEKSDKISVIPPNPKEYLNMKPVYYYIITLCCYGIVVLLSIVVGDVKVFFGIIGSTAAWFMILAGPGSFYIITVHKLGLGFPDAKSIVIYTVAWIYAVVGFSAMVGLNACVITNAIIN